MFAPAALAVLLLARAGTALDVELVLGIFAAFSAVMVAAATSRAAKGAYFASARVLTLVLALVLSYDAGGVGHRRLGDRSGWSSPRST